MGGSIESFGGNNSFGLTAEVLSGDFKNGFEVFADVLLHPSFPAEAFGREQGIQLELIRAQRDHLLQSCNQAMRQALFGARGYGLDPLGTESSVAALRPADAAEFYHRLAVPDNCVLAVFGDVSRRRSAESRPAGLRTLEKRSSPSVPPNFPAPAPDGNQTRHRNPRQEASRLAGRFSRRHDQRPGPLRAGTFAGRVQRPWTRACFCACARNWAWPTMWARSIFSAWFRAISPFTPAPRRKSWRRSSGNCCWRRESLRAEGLTAEELARCKAKVIGQRKIARQDLGGLALSMALDELYGLGYDNIDSEDAHYEAVTLEQIKEAAREYLTPSRAVIAVIRPPE